jgi:hypothetical protein
MEIVLPEKTDDLLGFRADLELQARIEELTRKSTDGELTEAERAEYAGYVRANKFVAILKRQAQRSPTQSHSRSAHRLTSADPIWHPAIPTPEILTHRSPE